MHPAVEVRWCGKRPPAALVVVRLQEAAAPWGGRGRWVVVVMRALLQQSRLKHGSTASWNVLKPLAYFVKMGLAYGARFRQRFTLADAIGSHVCSLEALTCV
jgi:hypothetical protein